jgi:hypothetical protein
MSLCHGQVGLRHISLHIQDREKYVSPIIKFLNKKREYSDRIVKMKVGKNFAKDGNEENERFGRRFDEFDKRRLRHDSTENILLRSLPSIHQYKFTTLSSTRGIIRINTIL